METNYILMMIAYNFYFGRGDLSSLRTRDYTKMGNDKQKKRQINEVKTAPLSLVSACIFDGLKKKAFII